MPFRPAFTLGSGCRGHRPAAAVAVSGANRGDCGRGFPGCRSRGGGHRLFAPDAPFSATLRTLIPADLPVVATLGNHEFWGRTFEVTLAKLKEQTLADPNIFYLDLIGAVELDGVNFVGGTLFFDGSMRIRDNQRVDDWDGWQDWRIVDIESRYMEFNAYYVDMIRAKMKPGMPTALCTHHVPHVRLNGHEPSHYSFYTGIPW